MLLALRLRSISTMVTIAAACLGALAVTRSTTAHAYCELTTDMPIPGAACASSGKVLSWRRQCVSFSMVERSQSDPTFEQIRDVADISFRAWTGVDCGDGNVALDVRQTSDLGECETPNYNTRGPNANMIIFVTDWGDRELPADAFGLTMVWHNPDTGEIYDADMQINEKLGTPAICNDGCPEGGFDLQNVITHEAGHFFGLGHSKVNSATMSSYATMGETAKRDLASDDIEGLCSIYGKREQVACETNDFIPNHGFSPACSEPTAASQSAATCSVTAVGNRAGWSTRALLFAVLGLIGLRRRRLRNRP